MNGFDRCLAHLEPDEQRTWIAQLKPGADIDLRGTSISTDLLDQILEAVRDDQGRAVFGQTGFDRTTFTGDARFRGAVFTEGVDFTGATFTGAVWLGLTVLNGNVQLDDVTFRGEVVFATATSFDSVSFNETVFEAEATLGPLTTRVLDLSFAIFRKKLALAVSAEVCAAIRTRFEDGVNLYVEGAKVDLTGTAFGAASRLGPGNPFPRRRPMVTSVTGADVANLTLVDVDLTQCEFDGAHHLDQLRMHGNCLFPGPPRGYTRRQVLFEELNWRRWPGWIEARPPDGSEELTPSRLVVLYRQLRKAQEDSKNEPGADDFYYGEMEMRRHNSQAPWSERFVLFLYWLVSGYGLRALRALGCLVALIIGVSTVFSIAGFTDPRPNFGTCLLYTAQSAVSLDPKVTGLNLTWQGEVCRLVMRLLGPLLLGLALLAIRNRVKR